MFDYNDEGMEDVAEAINEQLTDDEIIALIAELYFGLESADRLIAKRNIS